MNTPIDLIYVEQESGRTMSIAILNGSESKLLGPVDAKGAFKPKDDTHDAG